MKKLIACSSVVVLLFASANVFALPKVKRIKISKAATRLTKISKEAICSGKLRYARPKVSEVTRKATHATVLTQRMERALTKAAETRPQKARAPLSFNELQKTSFQVSWQERTRAKELGTQVIKNSPGDMVAFGLLDAQGNVLYAEQLVLNLMSDIEAHWLYTNRLNFVILSARKNMPNALTLVVDKMEAVAQTEPGAERYPAFLQTPGGMKRNIREYVYTLREGTFVKMREEDPAQLGTQEFLMDKPHSISVVTDKELLEQNQWPHPYL